MTTPKAPSHAWAHVLLWVIPGLWSSNYLIARLSRGVIPAHLLALGRWTLAFALLLPVVGATLWQQRAVVRQEWRRCLALGAMGMWVCGAFVYLGGQTTTATNIAIIYAITPVAIAAASVRLMGERLRAGQVAGLLMALVGVLVVICQGDIDRLLAVRFTVGDAWILAAAASWTGYSLGLKHWPSRLSPLVRLAAIILGGLCVLLPMSALEAWLQPDAWRAAFHLPALGLIALAALLPGVLSYSAHSYLQRELGAAKTALLLYLAPIYGAGLAWWFLGEVPGWPHVAGAALILPSIWLATRD
jgi:drug/metabolite transporter (DMT)-like permease